MNKSIFSPVYIASKLRKLGGTHTLELLLADIGDELSRKGDKRRAEVMRNAADIVRDMASSEDQWDTCLY